MSRLLRDGVKERKGTVFI